MVSHLKDRQAAVVLAGRQIEHFHTLMQHKRSPGSIRRHHHIRDHCGELLGCCLPAALPSLGG